MIDEPDEDEIGCVERAVVLDFPAAFAPANARSIGHIVSVLLDNNGGRKQTCPSQCCWACAEGQIPTSRQKSASIALSKDVTRKGINQLEITAQPRRFLEMKLEPLGQPDVDALAQPLTLEVTDGTAIELEHVFLGKATGGSGYEFHWFTAAIRSVGRLSAVGWAKPESAGAVVAVEPAVVAARRFVVVRRPTVVVAPRASRCFDWWIGCWIEASRRKGWLATAMRTPRRGEDATDDWG